MTVSGLIGTGGLAQKLGVSNTRIRQLESAGVIPPAQRLDPGDRRVWSLDEADAIKTLLEARRAARKGAVTAETA